MSGRIAAWSVTVALAGLLFGFDTAVISGADQPLQAAWGTSDLLHGLFVMSSALWGTVVGALWGNLPCERFGRKPTLIAIGVLYLVSAIGSALALEPYGFSILRFVGGLGVGASSIVVPAYISELAPAAHRGRLVALYQLQLVIGILIAYASNYALANYLGLDWRWMLGIESLPALVFLVCVSRVPESPRWLVLRRGEDARAAAILAAAGNADPERLIGEIRGTEQARDLDRLFTRTHLLPIWLGFLIAAFNQLSGINFIIYFAPRVFALAGLDSSAALLSTAGIGLVNVAATVLGLYLIDRAGRRTLMLIGSVGYVVSLGVVAWAFATGASGGVVVAFVFVFIAAHAVGQGAVIWVFIAEIFPNRLRTKGQSLGSGTHWVLAAMITLSMPYLLDRFAPQVIFASFAVLMVLQLLFVLLLMPETKGRSLEALADELAAHTPQRAA